MNWPGQTSARRRDHVQGQATPPPPPPDLVVGAVGEPIGLQGGSKPPLSR